MRISDWSSDVCSSDLDNQRDNRAKLARPQLPNVKVSNLRIAVLDRVTDLLLQFSGDGRVDQYGGRVLHQAPGPASDHDRPNKTHGCIHPDPSEVRSEEHTSELQSLMRISYAVFCLKKKTKANIQHTQKQNR